MFGLEEKVILEFEHKMNRSKFIKKIEGYINCRRYARFPRKVVIFNFILAGCLFEVTNPIEDFRIEDYGDEEDYIRLILKEINKGDVFYDIGACVGFIAVHAASKGAIVIAFEPDKFHLPRIIKNLELNKLRKVKIVDLAITDKSGEITLYSDGVEGLSPSLISANRQAYTVISDSIDNLLFRSSIPYPNIIKIDIEGAEILALKGMTKLLSSSFAPKCIFLELHPILLTEFHSTVEEVDSILNNCGYKSAWTKIRDNEIHRLYKLLRLN